MDLAFVRPTVKVEDIHWQHATERKMDDDFPVAEILTTTQTFSYCRGLECSIMKLNNINISKGVLMAGLLSLNGLK